MVNWNVIEHGIKFTFLFFNSSTVGLKLSFRSRYIFFSSLSLLMESLSSSENEYYSVTSC